jgi:predicted TIM-barrel fold metal-dependent hydrolase
VVVPDDLQVPLLDTHVHFWDHGVAGLAWNWLDPSFTQLGPTYQLDAPRFTAVEFREEVAAAGVGGMVHVHNAAPVDDPADETAWLQRMGEEQGWPLALVGACELSAADAPALVARHAAHGRLRSLRDRAFTQHLDVDLIAGGVAAMAAHDLALEVRVPIDRPDALVALADRWPSVTVVLGHAGLPPVRDDDSYPVWSAALRQVAAASPNVVCKVSAVAGGTDRLWSVGSIRRWVLGVLDAFGPERTMLGTNWPVDRLFGTYDAVVGAYRTLTAELGVDERHALFHGTAERVYRLPPLVG